MNKIHFRIFSTLAVMAFFILDFGLIPAPIDLNLVFTNKFIP